MSRLILSINAGSSSLKCSLYSATGTNLHLLAKAEISAINDPPAIFRYCRDDSKDKTKLEHVKDHRQAFEHVLSAFLNDAKFKVKSKDDIQFACHRIVHGGDFSNDQLITEDMSQKIEALSDLAPLHNVSAVQVVSACREYLPNITTIACFDSAFHYSIPSHVKSYAINQEIARNKGLRKYGFHGLSYSYILREVAAFLGQDIPRTSIIALHLGSGASACAIKNGKSIDTTMGLTPVSGLPGGTRSGDIDPSLIFHFTSDVSKTSPTHTKDPHISIAEDILNNKSGWKALTGTSNFAEIARHDAPETHKLALDMFLDRVVGYIGSYYVKLGGQVSALVFAGGIGEKSAYLRQMVVEQCVCLGLTIDREANANYEGGKGVIDIGTSRKVRTLICETDEEYEMARNMMKNPRWSETLKVEGNSQ